MSMDSQMSPLSRLPWLTAVQSHCIRSGFWGTAFPGIGCFMGAAHEALFVYLLSVKACKIAGLEDVSNALKIRDLFLAVVWE